MDLIKFSLVCDREQTDCQRTVERVWNRVQFVNADFQNRLPQVIIIEKGECFHVKRYGPQERNQEAEER